jgi:hypothetical protein
VDVVKRRLHVLLDLYKTRERAVAAMDRVPSLLGVQSQSMLLVADYVRSIGGFSEEDLAIILEREPRLLAYSLTGIAGLWSLSPFLP